MPESDQDVQIQGARHQCRAFLWLFLLDATPCTDEGPVQNADGLLTTVINWETKSFIFSTDFGPRRSKKDADNQPMKDEVKLVAAFLVLNAGVIALAIAGYAQGGMNIRAVLQHLSQ